MWQSLFEPGLETAVLIYAITAAILLLLLSLTIHFQAEGGRRNPPTGRRSPQ